jgi:hypothetical protein
VTERRRHKILKYLHQLCETVVVPRNNGGWIHGWKYTKTAMLGFLRRDNTFIRVHCCVCVPACVKSRRTLTLERFDRFPRKLLRTFYNWQTTQGFVYLCDKPTNARL